MEFDEIRFKVVAMLEVTEKNVARWTIKHGDKQMVEKLYAEYQVRITLFIEFFLLNFELQ